MIIENTKYGIVPVKSLIGCLCWFWDRKEEDAKIGILADYYEDEEYPEQNSFYELNGFSYKHCKPVEDYEISLYADKDCTTAGLRRKERALVEAIEESISDNLEYYKEEYSNHDEYNYIDFALDDHIECSVLEDDKVVKATKELIKEM